MAGAASTVKGETAITGASHGTNEIFRKEDWEPELLGNCEPTPRA